MRWIFVLLLGLMVGACDNSLDLNAEWQDIPIVYGLISASAENQYIRVEKAFLDAARPAAEIAVIPDSIYYANLKVSIVNLDNNEEFDLVEIDGNDEGLPREDGAFADSPNILYKITSESMDLSPGQNLELQIDRGENKASVTANTTVIDTVIITLPNNRVNFSYTNNFRVQWFPKSTGNEPSIYDVGMQINYSEELIDDPDADEVYKSLFWLISKNVSDTEVLRLGREFYVFLDNNLQPDPNVRRTFRGIDVVIDAGGEEILDYTRVGQANLGITASQEIPFYTNLSEGRGIFSSRNRQVEKGVLLSPIAKDSLVNGVFTKDLNFKN